jgi:hypothetical protein
MTDSIEHDTEDRSLFSFIKSSVVAQIFFV